MTVVPSRAFTDGSEDGGGMLVAVASPNDRWNHNIHYHPLIIDAIPAGCRHALDVGCGEGILARELITVIPHVTAIDLDEPSIGRAEEQDPTGLVHYRRGDFLTETFSEPFDFITSVAALHHMDTAGGLVRMADLLSPGGTLVIVGLARPGRLEDLVADAVGSVVHLVYKTRRSYWDHGAPTVWPPPETYHEIRRVARETLPGVRYRRHLLWRYSLVWTKPPT
jgi:SAM-dependent methyltransferase